MAAEPYFGLPSDEARILWQSCLKRLWIEFERAIPEEKERQKLALIPLRQCVDFLSVLGAAMSPDEAFQAVKLNPRAAKTVLRFALMLDEHFEKYPDEFYEPKIGKLVDPRNAPIQFFAASVQGSLEGYAEIHEPPAPQ